MTAMRRLKLKHGYHDARVTAVRYLGDDIELTVRLCSCCNPSPGGTAVLSLLGVRNFDDVKAALESVRDANASRGYVAEIVGIVRHPARGYHLGLGESPGLWVDAKGLHEA